MAEAVATAAAVALPEPEAAEALAAAEAEAVLVPEAIGGAGQSIQLAPGKAPKGWEYGHVAGDSTMQYQPLSPAARECCAQPALRRA